MHPVHKCTRTDVRYLGGHGLGNLVLTHQERTKQLSRFVHSRLCTVLEINVMLFPACRPSLTITGDTDGQSRWFWWGSMLESTTVPNILQE